MSYDVRHIQSEKFEVKDKQDFQDWMKENIADDFLQVFWDGDRVALNMTDGDMFDLRFLNPNGEEFETEDFLNGLCSHLPEGETAKILVMGFEKNTRNNFINYSYANHYEISSDGYEQLMSADISNI